MPQSLNQLCPFCHAPLMFAYGDEGTNQNECSGGCGVIDPCDGNLNRCRKPSAHKQPDGLNVVHGNDGTTHPLGAACEKAACKTECNRSHHENCKFIGGMLLGGLAAILGMVIGSYIL